ncbi:unnamed protein product [Lampetra planeri]
MSEEDEPTPACAAVAGAGGQRRAAECGATGLHRFLPARAPLAASASTAGGQDTSGTSRAAVFVYLSAFDV